MLLFPTHRVGLEVGSVTQRDIPGPRFVELMETYGIKPAELGITSRYKHLLKYGDRHPSRDLVVRLCALIYGKHGVVLPECQPYIRAGVVDPGGLELPTAGPAGRRSDISWRLEQDWNKNGTESSAPIRTGLEQEWNHQPSPRLLLSE